MFVVAVLAVIGIGVGRPGRDEQWRRWSDRNRSWTAGWVGQRRFYLTVFFPPLPPLDERMAGLRAVLPPHRDRSRF
jgi:hypothetical protein